jgi:DNA-binding FrmR family transcriptional regulator
MIQPETLSGAQLAIGLAVLILGPGGATAVGIRLGMNGLRKKIDETHARVEKIDGKLDTVTTMVHEDRAGIGRIEERVEAHAGWIKRIEEDVCEERRRHPR